MSVTRDKRRRNDLDLLVMALVSESVSTPYELKTAVLAMVKALPRKP